MPQTVSAGILLFKQLYPVQFYLCHMGGPYWQGKDAGAWGIPKGLVDEDEAIIDAAIRECFEETGFSVHQESLIQLNPVKMKSGKIVHAWAYEVDPSCTIDLISNTFEIEWPPKSGLYQSFPEVDKADWFTFEELQGKIISAQLAFCEELTRKLPNSG